MPPFNVDSLLAENREMEGLDKEKISPITAGLSQDMIIFEALLKIITIEDFYLNCVQAVKTHKFKRNFLRTETNTAKEKQAA
jgi:hypothetical protein